MRWRARTIVQRHGARRASRPQLKRDPLGSGTWRDHSAITCARTGEVSAASRVQCTTATMEDTSPQLPSLGLCQECKANPAVYLVLPTRQALSLLPGCEQARLGIDMDGKCYLDLGRGPERVLSLCDHCARAVPENAKLRFTT